MSVVSDQTVVRANPEVASLILKNITNHFRWQSLFFGKMPEIQGFNSAERGGPALGKNP